ncbi:unnamed protein product [Discosporangium mesarthrocarpum]
MGVGISQQTKLERDFGGSEADLGDERYFGFENFGNTCYCNSVLQALYFCEPLRSSLAEIRNGGKTSSNSDRNTSGGTSARLPANSVLSQLADLFANISSQKRRSGCVAPTDFLRTLQERNESFRGNMQQDAHEFFNFILNDMADSMVELTRKRQEASREEKQQDHRHQQQQHHHQNSNSFNRHHRHQQQQQQPQQQQQQRHHRPAWVTRGRSKSGGVGVWMPTRNGYTNDVGKEGKQQQEGENEEGGGAEGGGKPMETWIHRIFQGVLTNQTKCLCCETVSNRDEPFMDLSLDVEQNSSVTSCLRSFSSTETLTRKNKFFCDNCNALQEAEKIIRLKRLPRVLTLHLKRFKYVESIQSFSKLSHRVVFPLELRAPNMAQGDAEADADLRLYRLFAVVVHIGRGPNQGHYVAVVKSGGRWLLFDDDIVELVDEQVLKQCFGSSRQSAAGTNTGYLLLYDCGKESHGNSPNGSANA